MQVGEGQLDRVVDEARDLQPVVGEPGVAQPQVLRGVRVTAVVPEVRRDVVLVVLAWTGIDVFEELLRRSDQGEPNPLHDARVAERER